MTISINPASPPSHPQPRVPTVIFAGAGPGAVDLVTLRARQALDNADLVVYAGSLVNPAILASCRKDCQMVDSSHLDLDEQVRLLASAAREGKKVVRLHSGDPSLYGAIREQIQGLAREGVECEVIPGVTSAFAAAAALCLEYTVPNVSQSVVFTRSAGRTPLPETQRPAVFARTGASLVFYLSSAHFKTLTKELMEEGGLSPQTPCAIVSRASWEDQRILRGNLGDIAARAEAAGIQRQALLLAGEALGDVHETKSQLYARPFSHGYRNTLADETFTGSVAVLACSSQGRVKAREICQGLGAQAVLMPAGTRLTDCWNNYAGLVCVGATGLVVRLAAPLLRHKACDPALVSIDDRGRFAVSLCGGHLGGANRLARRVARITGGQAVVSTATDSFDMVAFDEAASREGCRVLNTSAILACNKALLEGRHIDFHGPMEIWEKYWASLPNVTFCDDNGGTAKVAVYWDRPAPGGSHALCVDSRCYVLGTGLHNNLDPALYCREARAFLAAHHVAPCRVAAVASLNAKGREASVQALLDELNCPFMGFESDELSHVSGVVTTSDTVARHMGTSSVSEAAALTAARHLGGGGTLEIARESRAGAMTFALARIGHDAPVEKNTDARKQGLVVVGLGSGQENSITPEVREAILGADVIAGYTAYVDFVRPLLEREGVSKEFVTSGMRGEIDRCRKALELAATGRSVCLVCSGDPGLLAMAGLILEMREHMPQFAKVPVRILPGVSAALLAAAALGAPLQNGAVLLSLSDLLVPAVEVRANLNSVLDSALPVALYNPAGRRRRELLREALATAAEKRGGQTWCAIVKHAGRPEQSVWVGHLEQVPEEDVDMSSLVIICDKRTRYVDGYLYEARGYADKYADKLAAHEPRAET